MENKFLESELEFRSRLEIPVCGGFHCIDSASDFEKFDRIKNDLNLKGEYSELIKRDEDELSLIKNIYINLSDYQVRCENFLRDRFKCKYKEDEVDSVFYDAKESIRKAWNADELIKCCEYAISNIRAVERVKSGFYDRLGIFVTKIPDKDFVGYEYEGYSYSFGFSFKDIRDKV